MSTRLRGLARSWLLPFIDPRQLASLFYLPKFLLDLRRYRKLATTETVGLADEDALEQRHMDLTGSIQKVTDEVVSRDLT